MGRAIRLLSGWLVIVLGILLVACGGEEPTESPDSTRTAAPTDSRQAIVFPTLAPGWNLYSRSTYQIALPESWDQVKLTEPELQAAIAAAQDANPPLADQLRTLLESGQYRSFVFYATDRSASPVIRNLSIARLGLEGTTDLSAFARSYANALPNLVRGAKVLEVQHTLQVNGIQAAELSYDVSLVDNAGTLTTLRGVQYLYRLDSGDGYLVTVTGSAQEGDAFMTLARQIGTSFVGITP